MARIQGIHLLAHGDRVEAQRIALDIQQHQRLLAGTNTMYGAGACTWYAAQLPQNLQDWPQVLFKLTMTRFARFAYARAHLAAFFSSREPLGVM
jgi:hypothetical protein